MNKIKNKMMKMNFSKFFRHFASVSVITVLFGAAASAVFRTHISELISYERSVKMNERKYSYYANDLPCP